MIFNIYILVLLRDQYDVVFDRNFHDSFGLGMTIDITNAINHSSEFPVSQNENLLHGMPVTMENSLLIVQSDLINFS